MRYSDTVYLFSIYVLEYLRFILAMVAISIFKPETKYTSWNLITDVDLFIIFRYVFNFVMCKISTPCVQTQWQRKITILTRVYIEVFSDRVSMANIFSLLHQQPIHSSNGWSYIIGSQVKWCWFFTCLLLQTTETSSGGILCPLWELLPQAKPH